MERKRAEIRTAEAHVTALKADKTKLEETILIELDKEGLSKATGSRATVSISKIIVPTVENWDKLYAYIARNKAFHLLERRPASKPWREEVESRNGKAIPGVSEFEKTSLNLRSL